MHISTPLTSSGHMYTLSMHSVHKKVRKTVNICMRLLYTGSLCHSAVIFYDHKDIAVQLISPLVAVTQENKGIGNM